MERNFKYLTTFSYLQKEDGTISAGRSKAFWKFDAAILVGRSSHFELVTGYQAGCSWCHPVSSAD